MTLRLALSSASGNASLLSVPRTLDRLLPEIALAMDGDPAVRGAVENGPGPAQ